MYFYKNYLNVIRSEAVFSDKELGIDICFSMINRKLILEINVLGLLMVLKQGKYLLNSEGLNYRIIGEKEFRKVTLQVGDNFNYYLSYTILNFDLREEKGLKRGHRT